MSFALTAQHTQTISQSRTYSQSESSSVANLWTRRQLQCRLHNNKKEWRVLYHMLHFTVNFRSTHQYDFSLNFVCFLECLHQLLMPYIHKTWYTSENFSRKSYLLKETSITHWSDVCIFACPSCLPLRQDSQKLDLQSFMSHLKISCSDVIDVPLHFMWIICIFLASSNTWHSYSLMWYHPSKACHSTK